MVGVSGREVGSGAPGRELWQRLLVVGCGGGRSSARAASQMHPRAALAAPDLIRASGQHTWTRDPWQGGGRHRSGRSRGEELQVGGERGRGGCQGHLLRGPGEGAGWPPAWPARGTGSLPRTPHYVGRGHWQSGAEGGGAEFGSRGVRAQAPARCPSLPGKKKTRGVGSGACWRPCAK